MGAKAYTGAAGENKCALPDRPLWLPVTWRQRDQVEGMASEESSVSSSPTKS